MKKLNFYNNKIGIIGLGYVGLPLALEFSKKFQVVGYDISLDKINNIKKRKNISEIPRKKYSQLNSIKLTNNISLLKTCNIFIITVPTPVHKNNKPDLSLLIKATHGIAKILKHEDLIIFESTVYPGTTEEICIPILEKISKLKLLSDKKSNLKNKPFFLCGYAPERINPTDRTHSLPDTNKIVSGSTIRTAKFLKKLYKIIIRAKVVMVDTIKIAEASKMLENVQRDLNIALINELSIIYNKLGIKTLDVLKAAGSKWNFATFYPGLVGGHCIGVDPYYMAYKAKQMKVKSDLILGGRKINDSMSNYVGKKFLSILKKKNKSKNKKKRLLIMGITFKENCPDVRNSKIVDLYRFLRKRKITVDLFDPIANYKDLKKLYGLNLIKKINRNTYDGIIIAVRHLKFAKIGIKKIRNFSKNNSTIFDLKSLFPEEKTDFSL